MAMYEDKSFRLLQVLNHSLLPKTGRFYSQRIGCITTNIHKGHVAIDGSYAIHMTFVQDNNGQVIKRSLRTSNVKKVVENGCNLEIHTENSIYIFEETQYTPSKHLCVTNLIELFFNDEDYQFDGGIYYDDNATPHELSEYVHAGMFQDSVLVCFADDYFITVCRYFPLGSAIEFYDTLYHQQSYITPMLIHNRGQSLLTIRFQGHRSAWEIPPGECVRIEFS